MIIDDSKDIHGLLHKFFKDEGYLISIAENGDQALKFLRATDSLPDVILLDLMMPVMDGYQFRVEQEKDSRLAQIPVVVMSAGADLKISFIRANVHGFLKKPFADLDVVLATVNAAIQPKLVN